MFNDYLIIHQSVLPDYYMKVVQVNQAMKEKKYSNIREAVKAIGISRSAYYKYKDYVFIPEDSNDTRKAVLSLDLSHHPGSLSKVLNIFHNNKISILTISQSLPIANVASVLISLDITNSKSSMNDLTRELKKIKEVKYVKLNAVE